MLSMYVHRKQRSFWEYRKAGTKLCKEIGIEGRMNIKSGMAQCHKH